MEKRIEALVRGSRLSVSMPEINEGDNTARIYFEFDSGWMGYVKRVNFARLPDITESCELETDCVCEIPPEIWGEGSGTFYFGVVGTKLDENGELSKRICTNVITAKISEGAFILNAGITAADLNEEFVTIYQNTLDAKEEAKAQAVLSQGYAQECKEQAEKCAEAVEEHKKDASNPHSVTAEQVGAYTTTEVDGMFAEQVGKKTEVKGGEIFNHYTRNQATGNYSHSEGLGTTASGYGSHSEGYFTEATKDFTHAEGANTKAWEYSAHSEGTETRATAKATHSEGWRTEANADHSHSEGTHTLANGGSQHVQGKYNIPDNEGKYADIVGNGADDNNRSNAYTLDWDGNAWFAGDVTVTTEDGEVVIGEKLGELDEKIESIEASGIDLSDYYTKEETDTAISEAVSGIDGTGTDLSDYYTKEETDEKLNDITIGEVDLRNIKTYPYNYLEIESGYEGNFNLVGNQHNFNNDEKRTGLLIYEGDEGNSLPCSFTVTYQENDEIITTEPLGIFDVTSTNYENLQVMSDFDDALMVISFLAYDGVTHAGSIYLKPFGLVRYNTYTFSCRITTGFEPVDNGVIWTLGNFGTTTYDSDIWGILDLYRNKVYTKTEVDEKFGDIGSALDELHAYAQGVISGGDA